MSTKLYVGNLPFDITENDLRDLVSQHGPVNEINVVMDKMTNRPRGFAFIAMNTEEGAKAAIIALNAKDYKGRVSTVSEARQRDDGAASSRGHGGASRSRH